MKKIWPFALSLMAVFVFLGCSSPITPPTPSEVTASTTILIPNTNTSTNLNTNQNEVSRDIPSYEVNSDLINRPGPRIVDGIEALARILNHESSQP